MIFWVFLIVSKEGATFIQDVIGVIFKYYTVVNTVNCQLH